MSGYKEWGPVKGAYGVGPRPTTESIDIRIIAKIANAIAHAEGYFDADPNVIPRCARNPGDLELGPRFAVYARHNGVLYGSEINGVTIFPKADEASHIEEYADGWAALYREVRSMLDGNSHEYRPDMTIAEVAAVWTATEVDGWASNVAKFLGVPVHTKLCDITPA